MLRKLVPFIVLALVAACSADRVTGPSSTQAAAPTEARHTGGMMGGGG